MKYLNPSGTFKHSVYCYKVYGDKIIAKQFFFIVSF